ncbi:MAG: LysR substrate-binding domain-containing protein [Acinetobacter sp.]
MELRHLRYFITVAEELNFSKAALKLFTAQPSLSQQIKDLEEEIGVKLFNRTKRKVELTEEGAVFLEQSRLVLLQAEKAVQMARQIHQNKQHSLRIGFINTAEVRVFPKVLPNLRIQYPDLKVDLQLINESDLHKALKRGDLDIIFSRQQFHDAEIESFAVLQDKLVFMLSKHHPLYSTAPIPLQRLQDQTFLMVDHPTFTVMNHVLTDFMTQHDLKFNISKSAGNLVETIAELEKGQACSILPQYIDPFIQLNHVTVCEIDTTLPYLHLYISYGKSNQNSGLQPFLKCLKQQFELQPVE